MSAAMIAVHALPWPIGLGVAVLFVLVTLVIVLALR